VNENDRGMHASEESSPNLPDPLGSPARSDTDHHDRRPLDGFDQRGLRRLDEDRLGLDADDALHGERGIGQ